MTQILESSNHIRVATIRLEPVYLQCHWFSFVAREGCGGYGDAIQKRNGDKGQGWYRKTDEC
jgi:hypothetical protein